MQYKALLETVDASNQPYFFLNIVYVLVHQVTAVWRTVSTSARVLYPIFSKIHIVWYYNGIASLDAITKVMVIVA